MTVGKFYVCACFFFCISKVTRRLRSVRACQARLKSGAFGQNTRHDLHPSGGNRGFVENLLRTDGSVSLSSPLEVL